MKTTVTQTLVVDAPPALVVEALTRGPISTRFADPTDATIEGDLISWASESDIVDLLSRSARIRPAGSGSEVTLSADLQVSVPYFGWLFHGPIRRAVGRSLAHIGKVTEARLAGGDDPVARRPFWMAPDRMSGAQVSAIATICMILVLTTYEGSLFSQLIEYIARTYGASNTELGVVSSITRVGTLASIIGSVLADRKGRRKILLTATACLSAVTLLCGLAPNLYVFGALQILSRGFLNMAAVVAFVAIIEEAPEGARAYAMAMASIAGGAGYAVGSVLLPAADLGPDVWRGLFLLAGPALLLMPGLRRHLSETQRFQKISARLDRARPGEIVDRLYGKRFFIVAISGFLLNFHAAPFSQFMNRYLADERGFGGAGILALKFFTQGLPALIAVWLGGRIAESSGRKPVATIGTLVASFSAVAFFMTSGPGLWLGLLVTTVAGAITGPSFATFNTELFPTEVRGTAGAALLAFGVAGSAAGLLFTGFASRTVGSLGQAIALTAAAPVLVGALLIRWLPEARGTLLDEISPPEV